MKKNSHSHAFENMLSQNGVASNFYENCTKAQKQAIMSQVQNISSEEQMQAFVEHLPSQAL